MAQAGSGGRFPTRGRRPGIESVVGRAGRPPLERKGTQVDKTISKPDANPIVALLLTWLVFGLGHLIVNGQQRKWLFTLLASLVGTCACLLPGIVIAVFSIVDAYQTAQRLQAGETIPENEYTFVPLFKVIKLVDDTATCARA
jgi:hypothetical protein